MKETLSVLKKVDALGNKSELRLSTTAINLSSLSRELIILHIVSLKELQTGSNVRYGLFFLMDLLTYNF